MTTRILTLATALLLTPAALLAQTLVPPAPTLPPSQATSRSIHTRKTDQQNRVANGVKSGKLTSRETSHLEHQETGINREEHGMRAQDNGHLSRSDKKTLDRQQNQESRRIDRDKHNARVR